MGRWCLTRDVAFVFAGLLVAIISVWGTIDLCSQRQNHHESSSAEAAHKQKITDTNIQRECSPLDFNESLACIYEHFDAQEKEKLQNEDARAQQEMALGSFWLWILGVIQALIAVGGIYYIASTVSIATASNDILRAEQRAWLSFNVCSVLEVRSGCDKLIQADVNGGFYNSGRLPAVCAVTYVEFFRFEELNHRKTLDDYVAKCRLDYTSSADKRGVTIFPSETNQAKLVAYANLQTDTPVVSNFLSLVVCVCYRSGMDGEVFHTCEMFTCERDGEFIGRNEWVELASKPINGPMKFNSISVNSIS